MQSISVSQKHHNIGYALYQAGQPITACQSNEQRRGWHNAQFGHMAATAAQADAETAAYLSMQVR
jgi:hypothetical protein